MVWERAPRGTKQGTQGIVREEGMPRKMTSAMLRSLVPYRFPEMLCEAVEREVGLAQRLADRCAQVLETGMPPKSKEPPVLNVGK